MLTMDTTAMRHRNGGLKEQFSTSSGLRWIGELTDTPPPYTPGYVDTVSSEHEQMWDVVIKDFHKRSSDGEVFNNPMISTSKKFKQKVGRLAGTDTYLSNGVATHRRILDLPYAVGEQFVDSRLTLSVPEDRLVNLALTSAYAGVSANDANAVLWLGEARETVKMVTDIGTTLWELYQKTKKQRLAWAKGKLTIPEAQSLTLGILYGILPLEQQIAQVMDGLFAIKENGTRHTSRGFQVHTETKTMSSNELYYGTDRVIDISTETVQCTVRAGVLYDIDISKLNQAQILMDPKQLVSTAYALARLSFVIDWFLNVGNTLKAWSPTVGTNILAAWVTIEVIHTVQGTQSYTIENGPTLRSTVNGDTSYEKEVRTKARYPVDRSDLAIIPRLNINLNVSKLSSLVLLFAKVKSV